ncbi:hypothetical protein [Nostoc sp. JL34]|uniref:hypothetical protein n=1 Tax=Nostoc sp. JL34 TaxID=2815397 RepID=UPI0025F698A3|nr:hypothetical protein [Nostoc sp. JL34]
MSTIIQPNKPVLHHKFMVLKAFVLVDNAQNYLWTIVLVTARLKAAKAFPPT